MGSLILPIIGMVAYFLIFIYIFRKRFGENLYCELGFIYVALVLLYTLLPALVLFYGSMRPGDPISVMFDLMSIKDSDLSLHFWRHLLFMFSFSIGYLYFRGREKIFSYNIKEIKSSIILKLIVVIIASMLFLSIMSASVVTYYDNYIRYDHLPFALRKLASALIRFKSGFYVILMTLLFINYSRYKKYIPWIAFLICLYELVYSHGSRIYIFVILIQIFFLYNYFVKIINLRKLIMYLFIMLFVFSSIEIFRLLDVDVKDAKNVLSDEGIKVPGELGAIYMPGFHLYSERNNGTLPKREWPMFFYDFISPITFNSFTKWNPMYWYAQNYFPKSEVPPFTLGPIAESAIWGGEVDLFFRGLINGSFFAFLVRWFLKRRNKWWAVAIYTFFISYSVITLKYSVFFYLTPLVKDLLPTIIFVAILMRIRIITKSQQILSQNNSI